MEWNNGWEMISALATVFGAYFAVKTLKRNHERQKKEGSINALKDIVTDHNKDNERVKVIFKEVNSGTKKTLTDEERNLITDFLNEMERISVAISMNVYDRSTFVDVWGNPFITTYKQAKKVIEMIRLEVAKKDTNASQTLYKEFEDEYIRIEKIIESDSIFRKIEQFWKQWKRKLPN